MTSALLSPTAVRDPGVPDPLEFARLVQRLVAMGSTPVAVMGSGSFVQRLMPTTFAPAGTLVGLIDDQPGRAGKTWAGLTVMDTPGALSKGVRGVIIAAYGREFERLWARRGPLREAGVSILACPCPFETKGWDECLIEQYECAIARERGLRPLYHRTYPPEHPVAWDWLLRPLKETARPGMSVLEVGSGAGLWTQHLIEQAGTYHAVDYSARLLYEAIEPRFARYIGKLRLHHDEKALLADVPDASVDLAFSFDVFVHFKPDLVHQYLRAMHRVLKPGGTILLHLVTWNRKALETWQEKFAPHLQGRGDEMHYNTLDSLRVSADAIGLRVEQVGPEVGWAYLARFTKTS